MRMLERSLLGFLALGLAILSPQALSAQPPGLRLEVDAGYDILGGSDFEALDDDLGFEGIVGYARPGGWEFGLGAGFSSHNLDAPGGPGVDQTNLFAEVRYHLSVASDNLGAAHPFVLVRLGYTRLDATGDASQDGLLAGAGGGLEYWISDRLGLLGAAVLHYLSYSDSAAIPEERNGIELSLRGGLKLRFSPSR